MALDYGPGCNGCTVAGVVLDRKTVGTLAQTCHRGIRHRGMAGHGWGGYGIYYSMASITAGFRGPCVGMAADDNRQASAPPFTHHATNVRRQLSILCSANVAALLVCGGGKRRDGLTALRIAYSTSATIQAPQTRLQGGR